MVEWLITPHWASHCVCFVTKASRCGQQSSAQPGLRSSNPGSVAENHGAVLLPWRPVEASLRTEATVQVIYSGSDEDCDSRDDRTRQAGTGQRSSRVVELGIYFEQTRGDCGKKKPSRCWWVLFHLFLLWTKCVLWVKLVIKGKLCLTEGNSWQN